MTEKLTNDLSYRYHEALAHVDAQSATIAQQTAEIERLRAVLDQVNAHAMNKMRERDAAKDSLADANAEIERLREANLKLEQSQDNWFQACITAEARLAELQLFGEKRETLAQLTARAEADQNVLDAMAEVHTLQLTDEKGSLRAPCEAELARRGLKS